MFFFFNDTATTEIYTLSLHDALPILLGQDFFPQVDTGQFRLHLRARSGTRIDRKSTRLNSSHLVISYAVFCLKKKAHDIIQTDVTMTAWISVSITQPVDLRDAMRILH